MKKEKKVTKPKKEKKVLSGPVGNMSGRGIPASKDDRETKAPTTSEAVGTAAVGKTRTPTKDKTVGKAEKIKAERKPKEVKSVTFEGAESHMVPVPKKESYVEGGRIKERDVMGKTMVSFSSENNFQYTTNSPDIIKGLRDMGFKEVK